jgi:hypothetical protein
LHVTPVSCSTCYMKQLPERREVLLGKIVDVLLAEGIAGFSLRPLAKTVGTSTRLLIYHFGEGTIAHGCTRGSPAAD